MTQGFFIDNNPFSTDTAGTSPTVAAIQAAANTNYYYTPTVNLAQLDQLTTDFSNNITSQSTSTPLSQALLNFGETNFYTTLGLVTSLVTQANMNNQITYSTYPSLYNRVQQNTAITPTEYASFVNTNIYTAAGVTNDVIEQPNKLLALLDRYYSVSFTASSMATFCSMMPNIFNTINFFFNTLEGIPNFLNNVISQIQNVGDLLNTLALKISGVIDNIINNLKREISNFDPVHVLETVASAFVPRQVILKAQMLKDEAQAFITNFNVQKFKEKVSNLISYAASLFTQPTLDEIEYLVYRFCSFIADVENVIGLIVGPMNRYTKDYADIHNSLLYNSSINTIRAVNAGALRYNLSQRTQGVQNAYSDSVYYGNPAPIDPSELAGVTQWNDGAGDNKISFNGNWVSAMGEEGWIRVDPEVRILLMRVQKQFNKPLIVNSGYRSPEYNRTIPHSAKNSMHVHGMAVDITWSGFDVASREAFIKIALSNGFRGIGRYNTFVHIDIGPARSWVGGY